MILFIFTKDLKRFLECSLIQIQNTWRRKKDPKIPNRKLYHQWFFVLKLYFQFDFLTLDLHNCFGWTRPEFGFLHDLRGCDYSTRAVWMISFIRLMSSRHHLSSRMISPIVINSHTVRIHIVIKKWHVSLSIIVQTIFIQSHPCPYS